MSRDVLRKIACREENLGPGAKGYRSLGTSELTNFDPFLLIDELMIDPDKGLPDHPHRGIQALTYVLKGQTINEDSNGYYGLLNPGDVQCLTVGKGVMHGVMPVGRETCHSIQLWLNLPNKHKMTNPKYQDVKASNLPKISKDGIHLKVISGRFNDFVSPLRTIVPTLILDFQLEKGAHFTQPIPNEWAAFIFVLNGYGIFGRTKRVEAGAHHLLLLSKGSSISFKNMNNTVLHFVLFAGQQLNEPIFRHGPYVMNSQNEINEAIKDFEQGKNGFEKAIGWRSKAVKRIANRKK